MKQCFAILKGIGLAEWLVVLIVLTILVTVVVLR